MSKPYTMTMRLARAPAEDAARRALDVDLYDRTLIGEDAHGSAFLNLDEVVPGTDLRVRELHKVFFRGNGGSPDDGLHLGKYLLEKLVADVKLGRLWSTARERRRALRRPLRLELVMNAAELAQMGEMGELPFELLADEDGFLFRRDGYVLVRAPKGLEVRTAELEPGDAVLVAWAQPKILPHVEDAVFTAHEQAVVEGARSAQLSVREPCRHASLRDLETQLSKGGGARVVSLVAHGDALGGNVWLHKHGDPARPDDLGEPVGATDLARVLRRGGVVVALLWVCHGAHRNEVFGDLATRLLHPEHGDLAAVVASPAALRAEDAARVAERILIELGSGADGDLERAVSAARGELKETDLQWAAPAYYARPSDGRSVNMARRLDPLRPAPTLERGMTMDEVLALPATPFGGFESFAITLERAPEPWPHFRGREGEIDDGLARLRAGRLVSLTGMPGAGKTELGLAIAQRALGDEKLAPERAVWLALDGVTSSASVVATLAAWTGVTIDIADKREVTAANVARVLGHKRCLVVLDNAEDPIRADRAAMRADLDMLLTGAPGLRLLLASREPLGGVRSAEEQALRVGPLEPGPAREAFLSAAGERLTAGERSSSELDRLLAWADGHPLTLMLLAKQLGEVSLRGLLRRIDAHGAEAVVDAGMFGEDSAETPDEKLRRERLVSSLDLSYAPLAEQHPSAAEMFAWLGLFPAGLVGALVEPVFGPTAEDDRVMLVRKSLADVVGPEQRLILPAPVRDYARKKLEELPKEKRWQRFAAAMRAEGDWLIAFYSRTPRPGARQALDAAKREATNIEALVDALSKMDLPTYQMKAATELSIALSQMLWPHLMLATQENRGSFVERTGRAGVALTKRLGQGRNSLN